MTTAATNANRTPFLLMSPESSSEHYNGDCDLAVIELTPDLMTKIRRRAELLKTMHKADSSTYEAYFWDGCAASFFSYAPITVLDECGFYMSDFAEELHCLAPADFDPGKFETYEKRTECNQMIVRVTPHGDKPDGLEVEVCWTAIPKHSSIYVTTPSLTVEQLESYAGGNG